MKEENTSLLKEYENPKRIRLKVFTDEVKASIRRPPKEYSAVRQMYRYVFDDHRTFLFVGSKCIGFMVSPYQLHTERHEALKLEGHKVIEMRQYHHPNAETLAVIREDCLRYIMWKSFDLK